MQKRGDSAFSPAGTPDFKSGAASFFGRVLWFRMGSHGTHRVRMALKRKFCAFGEMGPKEHW
jgi:hypothetical protein